VTALGPIRCAKCRRALTDPDSVARGLGPVCAARDDKEQYLFPLDEVAPMRERRMHERRQGDRREAR